MVLRESPLRAARVAATGVTLLLLAQGCFTLTHDRSSKDDGGTDADAPVDASLDACPPAAVASEFYVVQGSDAGCNTFPTIAAALKAANASSAASPTIHLAEGTYDSSHGESFPIELRGVSIEGPEGTGIHTVTISGVDQRGLTGVVSPEGEGVHPTLSTVSTVAATLLVGDSTRTTRLANLSISAPIGLPSTGIEGIVCERGNAQNPPSDGGPAGSAPQPAANTQIDRVSVQGFEVGVRVTWSSVGSGASATSGCNARITSSMLSTGNFGVFADGTLSAPTSGTPQYVGLQVGDVGKGTGNSFVGFTYSNQGLYLLFDGAAVEMADAVAATILNNRFARDDTGIVAVQQRYGPGLDIEDNDLGPLVNGGIVLVGGVAVAKLANNTIHDVTFPPDCCGWLGPWLGIGLQVNESWQTWPFVALARGNSFLSNDVGVAIRTASSLVAIGPNAPLPTDAARLDFGTASSPGRNRFRCNSATPDLLTATGQAGADVNLDVEVDQAPNVALSFEGNEWDHVPPTLGVGSARIGPQVVDVYEYGADAGALGATIDMADASTSAYDCPDGRVP